MPIHLLRRLGIVAGTAALLLAALPAGAAGLPGAPPAPAPVASAGIKYSEAELRLIHEEAVATGGATYSFYILGSDDRNVIQDAWRNLEAGRAKGASMKTLFNAELRQQQAFALPLAVREHLRPLAKGEHSAVFQLDKRNWALVELDSADATTAVPIFEALRAALPKLVTSGAMPDPRELAGNPALVQRSLMNKVTTTAEFDRLPPGFDVDMPLSNGITMLQRALARDDAAMVTAILTRAANANLCPLRACPLQIALRSKANAPAYVAALLAAGARPDQVPVPGDETALVRATANGDLESVRRLLQGGADRNGADSPRTPLSIAALNGNRDIGQLLLDKGADPLFRKPATDGGFNTPVIYAIASEKPEMVAWLRAAARKQASSRKGARWNYWIEQDGEKVPLKGGRYHLKRKPFAVMVQLPAGSELRLEASTSPRLFDEHKAADLRAPLYRLDRLHNELHDGSARSLLVSDYAARKADPGRHGGIQAWAWGEGRKDFQRVEKTAQGTALVREISALVIDDSNGKTEVPIEKTRVREVSLLAGTALDYGSGISDYANARKLRLVFDR